MWGSDLQGEPEVATVDTDTFWGWGAAVNYTLDPPLNSFPSLHVGTMTLATLVAFRVDRVMGALGFVVLRFTYRSIVKRPAREAERIRRNVARWAHHLLVAP